MRVTCTDFHGNKRLVDADQLIDRLGVYGIYIVNSEVLLIQDPRSLRWELPGGGAEKGETPEQCLVREFEEETGVTPAGQFTFVKEWEEYFFDTVGQQAWRSNRAFYLVEKIEHQDKLLRQGNGEDSAAAKLISLEKLNRLQVNSRIREIIEDHLQSTGK